MPRDQVTAERDELISVIDRMAATRVLVVGDVMLDRYWSGGVTRISPEAPVPVVQLSKTTLSAGGAANVAVNVAGLGAECLLCGAMGKDEAGEMLAGVLTEARVKIDAAFRSPSHSTIIKTRVVAHGQQIARVDQETRAQLSDDDERRLGDALVQLLAGVDAVVLSDYNKGLLTETLTQRLITASKDTATPLLVDPKGRRYEKYRGASILTPNRREAAQACELDETEKDVVNEAGRQLLDQLACEAVFITQGEEGMTLFRPEHSPVHFPASAKAVYDVTGAGDTVIATLAAAIGASASLETAARLANAAAGHVVEQSGTSAISAEELRQAVISSS